MKFRLRILLCGVTLVGVTCYIIFTPPRITLRNLRTDLHQSTDVDSFNFDLVNSGVLPVYLLAQRSFSNDVIMLTPRRPNRNYAPNREWIADYSYFMNPESLSPTWQKLCSDQHINLDQPFNCNRTDRRIKFHLFVTDLLGRRFEYESPEIQYDTTGKIDLLDDDHGIQLSTRR